MSKAISEARKTVLINEAINAGLNAIVINQKGVQSRADFGGGVTRKEEKICEIDGKRYSAAALKLKITAASKQPASLARGWAE